MHRALCVALVALLVLPSGLHSQQSTGWPVAVEPFAGMIRDAYDVGDGGSRLGLLLGARVGVRPHSALRVIATAGYARTSDVGYHAPNRAVTARNDWLLTTLGLERVEPRGRVMIGVGADLGIAWRRISPEGPIDPVDAGVFSDDWSPTEALVGTGTVRYALGTRVAASIGGRLHLYHFLENPRASPALTFGLAIR